MSTLTKGVATCTCVHWLGRSQGMDRVYLPFYRNLMREGKQEAFDEAMERIVKWPFLRLLPCHGTTIESGALEAFVAHMLEGTPQHGVVPETP